MEVLARSTGVSLSHLPTFCGRSPPPAPLSPRRASNRDRQCNVVRIIKKDLTDYIITNTDCNSSERQVLRDYRYISYSSLWVLLLIVLLLSSTTCLTIIGFEIGYSIVRLRKEKRHNFWYSIVRGCEYHFLTFSGCQQKHIKLCCCRTKKNQHLMARRDARRQRSFTFHRDRGERRGLRRGPNFTIPNQTDAYSNDLLSDLRRKSHYRLHSFV